MKSYDWISIFKIYTVQLTDLASMEKKIRRKICITSRMAATNVQKGKYDFHVIFIDIKLISYFGVKGCNFFTPFVLR